MSIKVLVADDSAFMRKMIGQILASDPEIEVVGTARDGEDAIARVKELQPDVLTLDVEMPVMDGVTALGFIMQNSPMPVVMVSSVTQAGAEATMKCLAMGAVDFVAKPSGSISLDIEQVGAEIIAKVKVAARTKRHSAASLSIAPTPTSKIDFAPSATPKVLVIGSSTGGPRALQVLVPALPKDLGVPIVIVQHMPRGFTAALAGRLNDESGYEVREAVEGDLLRPGLALVAQGGSHLEFGMDGCARLTQSMPVHSVRPSIDVTLASVVQVYGKRTMAVLLTGMGQDGARGLKAVKQLGGTTFAEDESTCVVYGMSKTAVDMDAVDYLLPLPAISSHVVERIRASKSAPNALSA